MQYTVLSSVDCRELISIEQAIASQRKAFIALKDPSRCVVPDRLVVPMGSQAGENAVTLFKPASMDGHIAVKIVSVVEANAKVCGLQK